MPLVHPRDLVTLALTYLVLTCSLQPAALAAGQFADVVKPALVGPPASATAAAKAPEQSPRDAVLELMAACRAQDGLKAEQFLDLRQLGRSERQEKALPLACQAKAVLDRLLPTNLKGLSALPTGELNDGLPAHVDHLVSVQTADGLVSLYLERYTDKAGVQKWRLSAGSVDKLPVLFEQFGVDDWEEQLPSVLVKYTLLDIKLWQWLALLVALVLVVAISRFAGKLAQFLLRRLASKTHHGELLDATIRKAKQPFRLLLGIGLFMLATSPLFLSFEARSRLAVLETALFIVAAAWFAGNLADAAAELARLRWTGRDKAGAVALLPLAQRVSRATLFVIAVLILLGLFGINVTAVLAGLGVGGLAVALAAQKTVENFFGGMMVAIDQPVRVGDFCRFGTQNGTVEDIGLRSTRLRTLTRTIVTIPNGEFSQLQIENFSKRDKMSFTTTLSLSYATKVEPLTAFLQELRDMLAADARVEKASLDVRLVRLGGQTTEVEIFAYILTDDFGKFKAVREELYLRIMRMMEARGLSFGVPVTQSLIVPGQSAVALPPAADDSDKD